MNALVIYTVSSEYADRHFIFWFPRSKGILEAALQFYGPGQPAGPTGRPDLPHSCRTRSRSAPPRRHRPREGCGVENI
jgi:hypothetical protein